MTSSLEKKEESTDVFSPKDLSLWKKRGVGGGRKSQRHATFLAVAAEHFHRPPLYQTEWRPDSQVSRPRLVLGILRNSMFTLLPSYDENINIILYVIIMSLISWASRETV